MLFDFRNITLHAPKIDKAEGNNKKEPYGQKKKGKTQHEFLPPKRVGQLTRVKKSKPKETLRVG